MATEDDIETQIEAKRAEIARTISELAQLQSRQMEDDGEPFVVAWVIGYEFTSTRLELEDKAGQRVFVGRDQPISASNGLGDTIRRAFRL